jgi:hypothetical protein
LRKREFLAHRNRGRSGDEIKEFIYQGGDPRQFVTCAVGNIDRDGSQMTTWAHVLAAGWAGREMLATTQLFAGPELGMSFVAGSEEGKSFGGNMKDQGDFVAIDSQPRYARRMARKLGMATKAAARATMSRVLGRSVAEARHEPCKRRNPAKSFG